MYLGNKESREENLEASDNFFNSPFLIFKLFEKGRHRIGTARLDRKGMPKMKPGKQMKRSDHEYQFTEKVACRKWFDWWSVTILLSNISDM